MERGTHPVAIFLVLCLAAVVGVVAIFSIWANRQLLDTGSWVSTSDHLLESGQVRHRIATFLGEVLAEETESQLLAAGEVETAAEVMPELRRDRTRLAERVVRSPQFARIWETANREGHRALVRVLDEDAGPGEGAAIDLTPALRRVADELEESELARELGASGLGEQVEPGAARIEVLEAGELTRVQDAVRVVRHLTLPAVLVAIALYLVALVLGRRRLVRTCLAIGIALAATGFLALLARSLAGHAIVDGLLGREADREAADAAWGIVTSDVHDLAIVAIAVGAGIVVASLVWTIWQRREGAARR